MVRQKQHLNTLLNRYPEVSHLNEYQLRVFPLGSPDLEYRRKCSEQLDIMQRIHSCDVTLNVISRDLSLFPLVQTESAADALGSTGPAENMVKHANVLDVEGTDHNEESAGDSEYINVGQSEVLPLGEFLGRPVLTYSASLALSTPINISFNPWDLLMTTASIRAKLRNYAYMKADLKVRIAVSGTPFHYGRLLVSWQPFSGNNNNLIQHSANIVTNANWRPLLLNYLSQAPGSFTIDVKENKPVELMIPFLSPKPVNRLYTNSASAIAGSLTDFANMGSLYIYSINNIASVSTSPTAPFMQIYCWFENVKLGTNTGTNLVVATESDRDEFERGPVETTASRLIPVSRALHNVPIIGPYAKASSFVLGALRDVAALFGWSRPSLVMNTTRMKNEPFSNSAITIGGDTTMKITLDPKQELTIDPRVLGSSEDEMSFHHIYTRPTYLATYDWQTSNTPLTSSLFTSNVHPQLVTNYSYTTNYFMQPTALAFISQFFAYWRGDIVFRFEIVCSSFHRGKVAIYYDPNCAQVSLIQADQSINKQFMRVIDIQETQTFEVCINWASARAWLKTYTAANSRNAQVVSAANSIGYANGFVILTPFTVLQSPDSSSVPINVYVYARKMAFNGFNDNNVGTSRVVPTQSMSETVSSPTSSSPSQPVTCFELNESTATMDGISEYHFGEMPISFRSLLRRYTSVANTQLTTVASTAGSITYTSSITPTFSNTYAGSFWSFSTLYRILPLAFVGFRGGTKHRLRIVGSPDTNEMSTATVSLSPPSTSTASTTLAYNAGVYGPLTINGSVTFAVGCQPGVEVETPFYSPNLFHFSFGPAIYDSANDFMESLSYYNFVANFTSGGSFPAIRVIEDVSAADDFSFLRFQGAPYYTSP